MTSEHRLGPVSTMPRTALRPRATDQDFTAALEAVTPTLRRYCRATTRRPQDAEDLFQRVSLRAWRGYATFRGEASFSTWVMKIARNEAARYGSAAQLRQVREPSLERLELDAADVRSLLAGGSVVSRVTAGAMGSVEQFVGAAVATRHVSEVEARVLLARFTAPQLRWDEIGEQLGMNASTCSAYNGRGWKGLCEFVFVERPDLLGRDVIEWAFRQARRAERNPLTDGEAEVFDHVVMRRERRYRRQGWQGHLRAACVKVAHHCREHV